MSMNESPTKRIQKVLAEASIYLQCRKDSEAPLEEAICIDYHDNDEECFYGTGEESGEEYAVQYSDVDLNQDLFYKLVLMDT